MRDRRKNKNMESEIDDGEGKKLEQIKEYSVLAPIEEEEGEDYGKSNYVSVDVNIIGDKLNNNDEDDKINEDISINNVEEDNLDETTIDN